MKVIGNSQFQKAMNSSLLLKHLLMRREASRIELAEELGLRPSTITYIINRLMNVGLIKEKAPAETAGRSGRPPIMLEINRDYGRVIGLDLQTDYYNAVITDAAGCVLKRLRRDFERDGTPFEELFEAILEEIFKQEPEMNILGVGMALPGTVDRERSVVLDCWTHNIKDRDFSPYLEKSFPYPVVIENDANCCAWKSLWEREEESRDQENETFIYLLPRFHKQETVPDGYPPIGIGLGLVFNGGVYHGHSFRAGEFRSVFLERDEPAQISLELDEMMRIKQDPAVLRRLIRELMLNMFALIHILNPRALIIGGDLAGRGAEIGSVLEGELAREWAMVQAGGCRVDVLEDAAFDAAAGAASSMLMELYSIPQVDGKELSLRKWNSLLSNVD